MDGALRLSMRRIGTVPARVSGAADGGPGQRARRRDFAAARPLHEGAGEESTMTLTHRMLFLALLSGPLNAVAEEVVFRRLARGNAHDGDFAGDHVLADAAEAARFELDRLAPGAANGTDFARRYLIVVARDASPSGPSAIRVRSWSRRARPARPGSASTAGCGRSIATRSPSASRSPPPRPV